MRMRLIKKIQQMRSACFSLGQNMRMASIWTPNESSLGLIILAMNFLPRS